MPSFLERQRQTSDIREIFFGMAEQADSVEDTGE
jgi:hypothetical protein